MGAEKDTQTARREQLRAVATAYFDGLANKNFAMIPYADDVTLRAPLAPGGVESALVGKQALETVWWPPLVPALAEVEVLEYYVNDSLTAICAEALVSVAGLQTPLRVCDRFTVNKAGQITEQVNYFDPRDVTHPGWR